MKNVTEQSSELPLTVPGATSQQPVVQMLQAVIEKGITADNVGALEKLVDLYDRMQAKDAEKQFATAFVALQAALPKIEAVKPIPDRNGGVKYYYAPLEEIMPKVRPALLAHGFTVSFNSEIKDDRVILSCTLMHTGGHHKTNISMAKIGSGPPGASGAQADGAASTYAKRRALCDALAIIAEVDTDGANPDARDDGAPITFEQAQTLKEMVKDTQSDLVAFLKFAGAQSIEEIGVNAYARCFDALNKKARR